MVIMAIALIYGNSPYINDYKIKICDVYNRTCTIAVGSCQCDDGFASSGDVGIACDVTPTCEDIGECQNGGSCMIDANTGAAYCLCPPSVTGTNCESTSSS